MYTIENCIVTKNNIINLLIDFTHTKKHSLIKHKGLSKVNVWLAYIWISKYLLCL